MSAFLVDDNHIRFLVQAAMVTGATGQSPEDTAIMLLNENIRSINHRYPEHPVSEIDRFDYHPVAEGDDPIAFAAYVLRAAACLEYQSCEHPEWGASDAKSLLGRLTVWADGLANLDGYAEALRLAPWEITTVPIRPSRTAWEGRIVEVEE